jgi:putative isomerase
MRYLIIHIYLVLMLLSVAGCKSVKEETIEKRYEYNNIFDIEYTPDNKHKCHGWFTDAGAWMGFTIPQKALWINGFCGPFSLDMSRRQWIAKSACSVSFKSGGTEKFTPDSTCYYPGELYISAHSEYGRIQQRLNFIDSTTAILRIKSDKSDKLNISGEQWGDGVTVSIEQNNVIARHTSGECVVLTFPNDTEIEKNGNNYVATVNGTNYNVNVAISFFTSEKELMIGMQNIPNIMNNIDVAIKSNSDRWNGYINKIIRPDMRAEYDRIAVKSIATLISNWRVHRGGLLHDGIIPSHAVDYFIGFWAWDSWRFSAGIAKINPELAKNNIRAMFDYQQDDGMIIDCIYTDPTENNMRDSKPPLVCWAVNEIFSATNDTTFVAEMYPQLLSYYKWWYNKRDNNKNGMCEYGSTDGTLEAAAWESGMDNAIRFDDASMLKNDGADNAWSMNQESVDLNAYLALECKLLKKFSGLLNINFDGPDFSKDVASYFFDENVNFFCDRKIEDGRFIEELGCEAYAPLWTGIATKEQMNKMLNILEDTTKFSTYIPFPTIAADNPKYDKRGYWRGPIWLDQCYFAINGLRRYGHNEVADKYTLQIFDRLDGLKESEAIHENYDTHTGECLKAPHFSWSASHLLMLYEEYGHKVK